MLSTHWPNFDAGANWDPQGSVNSWSGPLTTESIRHMHIVESLTDYSKKVVALEKFSKDCPDQPWILARLAEVYFILSEIHAASTCAQQAHDLITEQGQPADP